MRFLSLTVLAASLFVTSLAGGLAQANELDNEAAVTNEQVALSKDLPATLVVRTNQATGEVQVMHSAVKLDASAASQAALNEAAFVKVDSAQGSGELDRDSSRSSWYFCWNNAYSYPQYTYYGYSYNYSYNYYSYAYSGWNYTYYGWNYGYRY